jgi:hypothetical protein
MRSRWDGDNDRWFLVPYPQGSADFTKELFFNFGTSQWTIEGSPSVLASGLHGTPNISVGTINSGAITSTGKITSTTGDAFYGLSTGIGLELGVDGSKGGAIKLHGTTAGNYALIQATTNNLHIDAVANGMYLNWYDGEFVLIGAGNGSTERFRFTSTGNFQVGGQTVIDASRNITTSGVVTINSAGAKNALVLSGTSPTIALTDTTSGHDNFWIHVNTNKFYILPDRDGSTGAYGQWETPYALELDSSTNVGQCFGNDILVDGADISVGTITSDYFTTASGLATAYVGTTSASFRTGRNANEYFEFNVTDGNGNISYIQDETGAVNHQVNFNITSSSTGLQRFNFNKDVNLGSGESLLSNGTTVINSLRRAFFDQLTIDGSPSVNMDFALSTLTIGSVQDDDFYTKIVGFGGNSSMTFDDGNIDAVGDFDVSGSLTKGSGSFKIDHPLKPDTHHLVHSFVEGPQADNLYRGVIDLHNGRATIDLDDWFGMTPGTFLALNRDIQAFVNNADTWDNVRAKVMGSHLVIECQNPESNAKVSWLVIGERQDKEIHESSLTDDHGKVIVEPPKVG